MWSREIHGFLGTQHLSSCCARVCHPFLYCKVMTNHGITPAEIVMGSEAGRVDVRYMIAGTPTDMSASATKKYMCNKTKIPQKYV
jgi:hypothetical protein